MSNNVLSRYAQIKHTSFSSESRLMLMLDKARLSAQYQCTHLQSQQIVGFRLIVWHGCQLSSSLLLYFFAILC